MESFVKLDENNSNETKFKSICYKLSWQLITKVQIKSEWIYEIINFPKNDPKNLKDFCPVYCKNS
jgi:hypothetical protein